MISQRSVQCSRRGARGLRDGRDVGSRPVSRRSAIEIAGAGQPASVANIARHIFGDRPRHDIDPLNRFRRRGAPGRVRAAGVRLDLPSSPLNGTRSRADSGQRSRHRPTGARKDGPAYGARVRAVATGRTWRRGAAFATIDSFLLWRPTNAAVHTTASTNAARPLPFDIHRRPWDDEALALVAVTTTSSERRVDRMTCSAWAMAASKPL